MENAISADLAMKAFIAMVSAEVGSLRMPRGSDHDRPDWKPDLTPMPAPQIAMRMGV